MLLISCYQAIGTEGLMAALHCPKRHPTTAHPTYTQALENGGAGSSQATGSTGGGNRTTVVGWLRKVSVKPMGQNKHFYVFELTGGRPEVNLKVILAPAFTERCGQHVSAGSGQAIACMLFPTMCVQLPPRSGS